MVNYAILGGGRLARHFSHYFQLLGIAHVGWARELASDLNTYHLADTEQRLRATVAQAERVLLLVSDGAIGSLLKQYPFLHEKQLLHCSGAMSFPGVAGAHPLMTFADGLYDLDTYRSVPFMLETGYDFETLFPGLENPHYSIRVEDKARYHAMCVMAGNFSQILWKGVSDRFEEQLDLPGETLQVYLQQLVKNFLRFPASALTGPLARGDEHTIVRNLQSLKGDPLQNLYQAFVQYYESDKGQKPVQHPMEQVQ